MLKELQGKQYFPIYHGKATDALAILHTGDVEKHNYTKEVSVIVNGMKIKLTDQASGIGCVGMHKLLSVAIIQFCSQSHTGSGSSEKKHEVVIPLRDYAILCGRKIREDGAESKEEKNKEKNTLNDVRDKVNRDLNALFALELSWSEKKREKGKRKAEPVNYMDMHLISKKGIIDGNIVIDFAPDFAKYLTTIPITQYPLALLRIDERNRNAYSVGLQMAEHANMPSNKSAKTANLLKVGTLLKYTNLPGRDNSSVKKVGWRSRIKAPFEKSLDELTKCGLLQNWEYTHSKGVSLTDEEANFETFEEWCETLVHFVLVDQPDYKAQPEKVGDKRLEEQPEWIAGTDDWEDVAVGDWGDVAVGDWGMLL